MAARERGARRWPNKNRRAQRAAVTWRIPQRCAPHPVSLVLRRARTLARTRAHTCGGRGSGASARGAPRPPQPGRAAEAKTPRFNQKMASQLIPYEYPLVWEIVVVAVVLHLGAFVRARARFARATRV